WIDPDDATAGSRPVLSYRPISNEKQRFVLQKPTAADLLLQDGKDAPPIAWASETVGRRRAGAVDGQENRLARADDRWRTFSYYHKVRLGRCRIPKLCALRAVAGARQQPKPQRR